VFVVPASAAAVCLAGPWMKHLDPASVATGMPGMKVARLGIVELEIVAFLVVIIALGRYVQGSDASFRRRIGFGSLLAIVVCVSCVWLSFYYVNLLRATTPALRITKYPTSHNNVDRIVVLADIALAINRRLGNWDHKSIAELRLAAPSSKEPQQLQALYRQLLPLLDAPNALVYEPSTEANVKYLPGSVGELGWLFHSLARGLRAELDSAIAGNRFNDETDYALALVRLGDMVGRGGIESDAQLGTQIRGEGYQQLARLRSDLPSERLREAIETLRRSLAEREDPAAARTRQLDYEERNFGWGLRLQQILRRLTRNFDDEARQLNPRWAADADQQSLLVNLVLQADLAVRLFHHQQGRLPRNLDELAPNYLPSIPLDPYSHPLRLKVENGQFIVYSIGWDGIDNGGKFSHWWDYATGEWRAHVDRGTWKTTELAPGGEREYYGQPGIDFDLETLTRSFE
jgi:hypothetical protein